MAHEHTGHRDRMRSRFQEGGLDSFAPHEALELLLFYAIPQRDVNPLAHRLLSHFGTLESVLNAPVEQLEQVPGIGKNAACLLALIQPLQRMVDRQRLGDRPIITNYREAKAYCAHLFTGVAEEILYVVCLDAQGRVLRAVPAITGTIDEIAIYPRTIVAAAIRYSAHSVVLSHNHPSGVREPSGADVQTTDLLRQALGAVDIAVLDHIIYADGDCVSMAQWQQLRKIAPLHPGEKPKAADSQRPRRRGPSPMHEPEGAFDPAAAANDEEAY